MTALSAVTAPSPDVLALARQAAGDAAGLVAEATRRVRARVAVDGRISPDRLEAEQQAAHGLAWLSTYAVSVRELAAYAERMSAEGRFGETEELLTRIGVGEYLDQIFGGIPMSQGEIVRPHALGLAGRGRRPLPLRCGRNPHRPGQHAREPRPPRGPDPGRAGRADHRRRRPRRHPGGDPRRDAPLRPSRGRAPRARVASRQRLHPDGGHRAHGRPRRVRPHDPGGVRRAWACRRSPCAWSRRSCRAPTSASARSAPAPRSRRN